MTTSGIFPYGSTETAYLAARDPVLGAAIARIGQIERAVIPDLFEALVFNIVGQQISSKALETVWARVREAVGGITPQRILAAGEERLRGCGLSGRKAGYMLGAAQAAVSGAVDFAGLADKPDEDVVRELTALSGVGRWTAEMLLIFSLCRPDVLSYDDFGIRKGLCRLHGLENISRADFAAYRERYKPYGTVAAFYLWEIAAE